MNYDDCAGEFTKSRKKKNMSPVRQIRN